MPRRRKATAPRELEVKARRIPPKFERVSEANYTLRLEAAMLREQVKTARQALRRMREIVKVERLRRAAQRGASPSRWSSGTGPKRKGPLLKQRAAQRSM